MTKVLGLATLAENEGCIIVCDFQSVDPIVFLSVSNVPFPIPFPKTFLICFHSFHETCPNIAPAATSKFTVLVEILNSYEQLVLGSLKVALSMHSPQNSLISRTHETDLLSCQLDECQLPSPPPHPHKMQPKRRVVFAAPHYDCGCGFAPAGGIITIKGLH